MWQPNGAVELSAQLVPLPGFEARLQVRAHVRTLACTASGPFCARHDITELRRCWALYAVKRHNFLHARLYHTTRLGTSGLNEAVWTSTVVVIITAASAFVGC